MFLSITEKNVKTTSAYFQLMVTGRLSITEMNVKTTSAYFQLMETGRLGVLTAPVP